MIVQINKRLVKSDFYNYSLTPKNTKKRHCDDEKFKEKKQEGRCNPLPLFFLIKSPLSMGLNGMNCFFI